ncbi:MAG TPA: M43 family zinc metalloprotease [Chitinophagaceae bacterium]|jgi:hypothetical protein|nr:M43 family zinc metalloprotease [Chitinophagaceae bacterium]
MRKIVLAATTLFLFTTGKIFAQRTCASYQVIQEQMRNDPQFARKVREKEKSFENYVRKLDKQRGKPTTITIPVAVHVLYSSPDQNISDAQVQSQIDVLNEDFTATNRDYNNYDAGYGAVKGDMNLKFCLVQTVHRQTRIKSFAVTDNMKYSSRGGDDAIDPIHILNIWVCNLSGGVLGFAYYPGISPEKFGVVCHTNAFGRGSQYNLFAAFNLGRTVTHEIGHCFGLVHIWGDAHCGNDFVDDTPLQNDPNFGCPGEGHLSTCTGTPLEMWMNYMDYTDDRCMYFHSDGQVARANFFIDTDPQLQSIVSSTCTTTASSNTIVSSSNATTSTLSRITNGEFAVYPSLTQGRINIELSADRNGIAMVNIYNVTGALMMKQQITVTEGMNIRTMDLNRLQNGVYILQLNRDNTKAIKKLVVQH